MSQLKYIDHMGQLNVLFLLIVHSELNKYIKLKLITKCVESHQKVYFYLFE